MDYGACLAAHHWLVSRSFMLWNRLAPAGAPFGMPGPFDPTMGGYQLGMPGGDPYAAAAFGMQPQPDAAMFQAYQQANGAALASLMRPNGMGPGGPGVGGPPGPVPQAPSSGAPSSGGAAPAAAPAPASSSSQMNGKQATAAAEGEGAAASEKGAPQGGGKTSPALLGTQLFAIMG